MNAELNRAETEDWTQWERQIVNGVFPLRRLLGHSAHGAVFLTEHKSKGLADAAIKLVRAHGSQAQVLQSQWQAAAALSHPHLIRLFDVGRCQLAGHEFVFAVMEHADQTLAGILRHRPLAAEEVQELLVPTLEALTYLHRRDLAHGQLKPSNLLAAGDQLKLASDTVRAVSHDVSTADDMLSLGMTLVEALTQRRPALQGSAPNLPDALPSELVDTVRRCLNKNAAERPTVIELRTQYKLPSPPESIPKPPPGALTSRESISESTAPVKAARESIPESTAPVKVATAHESDPAPQPHAPKAAQEATPPQRFGERSLTLPDRPAAIAGVFAGALLIALAVWIGSRATPTPQADLQPGAVPAPSTSTPSVAVVPTDPKPSSELAVPPTPSALPPEVLHQVLPDVSQNALSKIQGRIFVMVRVLVDPSGNVVGALMEDPGRSKHFARAAENAAREWRFVPSDKQRPRVWILRFAFTRDGVTTRVIEQ
ncbi:protein kinase [Steroidobacter sp. S1-65]|uniref:Protein kinase n=1 Tax=Steroidobacter gossypii TaxID=2805490 RepID=A0ABS1WV33_9GAMM|nr:protein kinase [Steroidobacter gossypii]MBM0104819.1 protein kinase [Steroidobacter gossypii]